MDSAICLIWLPLISFILSVMCSFNNLSSSLRILFSQAFVVFLFVILRFFLIFCNFCREIQKYSNFPTLLWICRNLEVRPKLTFKNPNFSSFSWIGKNWTVQLEQNSKIPILSLFVNQEKVRSRAKSQHSKIPILNLRMNWRKVCASLSFAVESKENLHKIRLVKFQT